MAGKPEDKANNSYMSSLDDAKAVLEKGIADLQGQADEALKVASSQLVAGGAVVVDAVREGVNVASQYADEGKAYVDKGLSQLKEAEDVAVSHIKYGLELIQSNTYVSYPLLATGGLLLLPGTRRLLYRATLGRLRSTDNIVKGAEGKVEGLRVKLEDFGSEAKKLQERMVAAEEEYLRGRSKLKATRQELQRLEAVVAKSEKAAAGVLEDLRTVKKVDKAVAVRAEAASQVSALKAQRNALRQYIYRIVSKDV